MTKIQQVYRELRKYVSKGEARYAAIRLVSIYEGHSLWLTNSSLRPR